MTKPCSLEPDRWFSSNPHDIAFAKDACLDCPLMHKGCQEEGWNHTRGVWGGMSSGDRQRADPSRYLAAERAEFRRGTNLDRLVIRLRDASDVQAGEPKTKLEINARAKRKHDDAIRQVAINEHTAWTAYDDAVVLSVQRGGLTIRDAALKLGRSRGSVEARRRKLLNPERERARQQRHYENVTKARREALREGVA